MIDINELRMLVQDFKLAGSPMLLQTTQMGELLDRLDVAESEALEEARLNGMGSEREAALMAKLEAVEKERNDFAQQLVQSEIGKREISEAHDALQVEVGKLKDLEVSRCVKINGYIVDNARLAEEVERLRTKIAEMEQQEPYCTAIGPGSWTYQISSPARPGMALYSLPGAKGEEK